MVKALEPAIPDGADSRHWWSLKPARDEARTRVPHSKALGRTGDWARWPQSPTANLW